MFHLGGYQLLPCLTRAELSRPGPVVAFGAPGSKVYFSRLGSKYPGHLAARFLNRLLRCLARR